LNPLVIRLFIAMAIGGLFFGLVGCTDGPGESLAVATLDELKKEENGLHFKSTGELFTGYLTEYYPVSKTNQLQQVQDGGSQLKSRSVVRGGKLNGLSEGWYSDGQQQVVEVFVDGKSHGVRVKWHRNGWKAAEDSIEHGELNGVCRKWHDNGQLAEEMAMVDGQADGQARSWHPDGSQKAEVLLEKGKVVKQQFWEEGVKLVAEAVLPKQAEQGGEE
jgi:antitoxin component YwqK of YwqJK toxin-antitoxin module